MITAVTFDLWDTLVTDRHLAERVALRRARLREALAPLGVYPGDEELERAFAASWDNFDRVWVGEHRTPSTAESLDVVLGSPLGLSHSVTSGIVSGLNRNLPAGQGQPALVDLIQTDAPISPGNSGGAVVNADGEVIGISEAYIPPNQGAVALGFATPAATVVDVADQLLQSGKAQHAYLGIQPATLTPQIASSLGLSVQQGVLVYSVYPGTPAAQAGLQPGDVLTAMNGQPLASATDLQAQLRQLNPGQTVTLTDVRGNQTLSIKVTLTDRPQ